MSTKFSPRLIITIIFLNLAGQIAWAVENQYYNVFLYNEIAPSPFYISLIVSVTAVVAAVTAITMGALSDVLGKRKVFLIIGYILWAFTTAIFPLAALFQPITIAVTIAVLFDSIMTFFGSTAYDAVYNAYFTDMTNKENRGRMTAIAEIILLVSILLVYGLSGVIIDKFGFNNFFYIVGISVGIIGIIGALLAPKPKIKPSGKKWWETIKNTFTKAEIRKNKNLFLILIASAIWGIGFNVFFPFVLIYLKYQLGLSILESSLLIFIAFLASMIGAIPIGKLIDKIGRKKVAIIAICGESIFLTLFAFMKIIATVAIIGSIWIFAMTVFDISSTTWLKDLYPEEKRGQFSGYYILFTVLIAMTIGSLLGGFLSQIYGTPIIVDGIPGFIPPPLIFIVAAIIMLLTLIPLIIAKEHKEVKI